MLSPGMTNRCARDYKITASPESAIDNTANKFLVAEVDGRSNGFVMFSPLTEDSMCIHLYLRSKMALTREIVRKALYFAFTDLCLKRVYAVYPSTRKALIRLANDLGFVSCDPQGIMPALTNPSSRNIWRVIHA